MIQEKPLVLLLSLFCSLVVAACTPTARPSQATHVATAATAPDTSAATTAAVAAESKPADPSQEIVCKTFTPTGTRFQKSVCATQARWDELQQDARVHGEGAQRKAVQVGNPQGN